MERVLFTVPNQADMLFLIDLAKRLNYQTQVLSEKEVSILEKKLDNYIKTSPKNVPLTSKEIMDEVKKVRSKSEINGTKRKN